LQAEKKMRTKKALKPHQPLQDEDLGFPHPQFLLLFLKLTFPILLSEALFQALLYKGPH